MRIEEIPAPKYKVSYTEKFGKYLVAAERIDAGKVIFREDPVVVGVADFNQNNLCFGCFRVIPHTRTINFMVTCSQCRIAVFCSNICESNKGYHASKECELFKSKLLSKNLEELNMQNILLPLRLILIKDQNEEQWQNVLELESHLEVRRNTPVWKEREENVINRLKNLQLINNQDDELIQQICGILDVNTFELRSPGSINTSALRGLYINAALMAHNCQGNTYLTVDDKFHLIIYANQPINEGDPIFFNYTSSLLGTAERKAHLRQGKYFECDCDLCKDPDELGTNLSSLICPRCKKGMIRYEGLLMEKVYFSDKHWKCNVCNKGFSGKLIKTTLELGKLKIDQIEESSSIKELQTLLQNLSLTFHSNHYLMLTLKQKILQLYRSEISNLHTKKKILVKMINLCKEVLEILEIVEPGLSRLKGIMLYEIHLPSILLANQEYMAREINLEELMKRLENGESYLKRSLSMLLLEPAETPEGLLAKRALQDLKALRQNTDNVKSLLASPDTIINNLNPKQNQKRNKHKRH